MTQNMIKSKKIEGFSLTIENEENTTRIDTNSSYKLNHTMTKKEQNSGSNSRFESRKRSCEAVEEKIQKYVSLWN